MLAFAADRLSDGDLTTVLLIVVILFALLAGYLLYVGRTVEAVVAVVLAVILGVVFLA